MSTAKPIPPCPGAPQARDSGRPSCTYPIRLITPMFGGGAEAGRADDSFPVRPTSIRGHLQFWWRATHGASCADAAELARRHAEVWGTTEQASRVRIEVRNPRSTPSRSCIEPRPGGGSVQGGRLGYRQSPLASKELAYALFPFKGENSSGKATKPTARFIEELSFDLHVECSTPCGVDRPGLKPSEEILREVEAAIRAWVNFGGLGARTRRGCGSIFCQELAPKDIPSLHDWFHNSWKMERISRDWTTLPARFLVRRETGDALRIWEYLIGFWQHFRQGAGFARNGNRGRSLYPEAETIRAITRRWSRKRQQVNQPSQTPTNAFPRAELGLPIVFQFKDSSDGDPWPTFLYPADQEGRQLKRMASPLILRPLGLINGDAVPLIMRLNAPPPTSVILLDEGGISLATLPQTSIRDPQLSQYPGSPLVGDPDGSALGAFERLALSENNFVEIAR